MLVQSWFQFDLSFPFCIVFHLISFQFRSFLFRFCLCDFVWYLESRSAIIAPLLYQSGIRAGLTPILYHSNHLSSFKALTAPLLCVLQLKWEKLTWWDLCAGLYQKGRLQLKKGRLVSVSLCLVELDSQTPSQNLHKLAIPCPTGARTWSSLPARESLFINQGDGHLAN